MPAIWGDKHFVEIANTQTRSWLKEIKKSGVVEPIKISRIVDQVASYFNVDQERIYLAQRGAGSKNIVRWIAMKLSQDYSGQTLTTIGSAFGVGNYCTVSQTVSRLKKLMEKDKRIAKDFNAISKDLTP